MSTTLILLALIVLIAIIVYYKKDLLGERFAEKPKSSDKANDKNTKKQILAAAKMINDAQAAAK